MADKRTFDDVVHDGMRRIVEAFAGERTLKEAVWMNASDAAEWSRARGATEGEK